MIIVYAVCVIEIRYTCLLFTLAAEPVFLRDQDRPMNLNVTEGRDAKFRCQADAKPTAEVQWYINGEPLDRKALWY